ncbi:uncharacterized protein VTP21DRAFT_10277 [Calcarisporiella thermophila]|uniref:uncharacterized protein n=1 Tax=Calcarisporiella thermophila TaxID=911321 RepID=UPI003743835D
MDGIKAFLPVSKSKGLSNATKAPKRAAEFREPIAKRTRRCRVERGKEEVEERKKEESKPEKADESQISNENNSDEQTNDLSEEDRRNPALEKQIESEQEIPLAAEADSTLHASIISHNSPVLQSSSFEQHPASQSKSTSLSATDPASPAPAIPNTPDLPASIRSQLPLPRKYERLLRVFDALQQNVFFLRAQHKTVVFHQIKKNIENMCRRNVELEDIARIKSIYPEAFVFCAVQIVLHGKRVNSITIDIPTDAGEREGSEREVSSTSVRLAISSHQVEGRLQTLRDRLIARVWKEHDAFLERHFTKSELVRWKAESRRMSMQRWHPRFDLERVQDIAAARLPSVEKARVGLEDVVGGGGELPARVERVLRETIKGEEGPVSDKPREGLGTHQQEAKVAQATKVTEKTAAERGGEKPSTSTRSRASALLERIREKERRKHEQSMFATSTEEVRKRAMVSRLPAMADSIAYIFASHRKSAIGLRYVANKISESQSLPLSEAEVVEHIKMLADIVPQWCKLSLMENMGGHWLRLETGVELTEVRELLKAKVSEMLK